MSKSFSTGQEKTKTKNANNFVQKVWSMQLSRLTRKNTDSGCVVDDEAQEMKKEGEAERTGGEK